MIGARVPPKPETTIAQAKSSPKSLYEQLQYITPEWRDKLIACCAHNGDFEPLTDALFSEDEIGPFTRAFLIMDFGGQVPRKRGNKATTAQLQNDLKVTWEVVCTMNCSDTTEAQAITKVAKDLNRARTTVQSIFNRTIGKVPWLRHLDGD